MRMPETIIYRTETQVKINSILTQMTDEAIDSLLFQADIQTGNSTIQQFETLFYQRGGYLLIKSGLVTDVDVMYGTVFSFGGIEYIIGQSAAAMLHRKQGYASVEEIGRGKIMTFKYAELMNALYESNDFDQMELKNGRYYA